MCDHSADIAAIKQAISEIKDSAARTASHAFDAKVSSEKTDATLQMVMAQNEEQRARDEAEHDNLWQDVKALNTFRDKWIGMATMIAIIASALSACAAMAWQWIVSK